MKIEAIKRLLRKYADRLPEQFVVFSEEAVRFARLP